MKKTLMPLASFSSGKRDQRTKRQGSWTRFSFLALLVLLMIATTEAGIPCNADAQCRRDVCISKNCASRPTTNGICEANKHCFNAATESCIKGKCLLRSNLEGTCDDSADCATSEAICQGAKCLMPFGKTCSANAQCVPPSVCINKLCASKSPTGGDCDDGADCAAERETCSLTKCAPFDPSLMVWDGNKAPLFNAIFSPSVAVNGNLFVFEAYEEGKDITVEAYDPVAKTWSSKTGPGIKNYYFSVVAVGTDIFLIGGIDQGTVKKTFYRYDTVTNKWETDWTQLPEARYSFAAAAVDKTVFIFGGGDSRGNNLNTIRSLDVSTIGNSWNLLTATLPATTTDFSAVVVDTDIYLTGGSTYSGTVKTVLKYDTLTPTVNPVVNTQTMIEARTDHMSFYDSTNNRLYAVGGSISNFQNAVEYLDLNNPTGPWVSAIAPNYKSILSSYSGGLINSLFHFVSYNFLQVLDVSVPASVKWSPFPNSPSPYSSVFQMTGPTTITAVETSYDIAPAFFNTLTNTWTTGGSVASYPDFTSNSASTVINGELYVMGGEGDRRFGTTKVYALNAAADEWTQKDDLPSPTTGGCAAADGTDIYFYGGASDGFSSPGSTLYKMDTTKESGSQWTEITPAGQTPTAVMGCAAVIVGKKLLIFGGATAAQGASPTDKVQSFDIPTKSWDSVLPNPISPRSYLSAVFLKGFVFVIGGTTDGGFTSSNKVEVFDVNTKSVTVLKDLPSPRSNLGSVTDGSSIFSVGGVRYTSPFSSLEKLRTP